MKRIDWQAFEDGSMLLEERQVIERMLSEEPSASRQLDGLKECQAAIRDVGLSEPVPIARLEHLLAKAAQPVRPLWSKPLLIGAPMFALAAAVWLFFAFDIAHMFDPLKLDRTPTIARYETDSPIQAAAWAASRVSFQVPVVDLGSGAKMFMTRHGKNWVCYDYIVNGREYYLYLCPDPHPTGDAETVTLPNGRKVLKGQGLRWREGKMCLYLRGPDDKVEIQLANKVSNLLETWNSPAQATKVW